MSEESAESLYIKLCRLPKDEQIKFLKWARDYIRDLGKELKEERQERDVSTSA